MTSPNSSPSPLTAEPLRRDQAQAAGILLSHSHADYPAFTTLFPDDGRRARVLRAFMTGSARDAAVYGHALCVREGSDLLGVALWMPPDSFPLSTIRKVRMTPSMLRVAVADPNGFLQLAKVGPVLERDHPDGWYLQGLGVHPKAQRRGVGHRLIEPALERADAARAACHLHTSDADNIAYYQRFGFAATRRTIETHPNGPVYIAMTRRPPDA